MSKDREAVIVGAARTAIGKFMGTIGGVPAPRLGAVVIRSAVTRAGIAPDRVEDVIMGCVLQAGVGQAPARQAAIHGGIPARVGAMTDQQGLRLGAEGRDALRAGHPGRGPVLCGGRRHGEHVDGAVPAARRAHGYRLGDGKLVDSMVADGLWDSFNDSTWAIGGGARSRRSTGSPARSRTSTRWRATEGGGGAKAGEFDAEIVPVEIPQRKGDPVAFADADESVRADTSAGGAGQAQARVQEGRHGDGGQRARLQRRRRRGGRDVRRGRGEGAGAKTAVAASSTTRRAAWSRERVMLAPVTRCRSS